MRATHIYVRRFWALYGAVLATFLTIAPFTLASTKAETDLAFNFTTII